MPYDPNGYWIDDNTGPEPAGPNPGFDPGYTGTPIPDQPNDPIYPTSTGGGGGGGGFQMPAWLHQLMGGSGGMSNFLPALASALSQWRDAKQYRQVGREASAMASPVDTETRKRYQQRMEEFYTDPTGFLERNPQFMATKKLGLNALNARNASRGHFGGDGKATTDELEYISTLGSRFLDQEQKNLMNMGGFQFDPANGAKMLMEGTKQEIDARNGALRAMGYGVGGGPGGGGGGPIAGIANAIGQALKGAGKGPAEIAQALKTIFPNGGYTLGSDPWGSGGNEPEPYEPTGTSTSNVTGYWDADGQYWPSGGTNDDPFGVGGWDTGFNWDNFDPGTFDWGGLYDSGFDWSFGGGGA